MKRDDAPVERNAEESPSDAIAREERHLAKLLEDADRTRDRLTTLRATASAGGVVSHQGSPSRTSFEKVALFLSLFRGRQDVFPVRFVSKRTGKAGYTPACRNKFVPGVCELPNIKCGECQNQAFFVVNDAAVLGHLTGRQVMGVYPLLPDVTCWFLVGELAGVRCRAHEPHLARSSSAFPPATAAQRAAPR